MRKLVTICVIGIFLAAGLTVAALATTTTVESNWGPLSVNGGLAPKTLPKHEKVPVTLQLAAKISSTADQTPALRELVFDFDKNGGIDSSGFAICERTQLRGRKQDVQRSCRDAIIGAGAASIKLIGQSTPVSIPLTFLNGGQRDGEMTIFAYAVIPGSTPIPVIVPIKLERHNQGRFGLRSVTKIPLVEIGASLLSFRATFSRDVGPSHERRSFAVAQCSDRHLDAELTRFVFSGGAQSKGERLIRACTPTE